MEWMLMPLHRYADFSGRSRRKEYWMFFLLCVAVSVAISIIGSIGAGTGGDMNFLGSLLMGLFFLAIIVPSIALQVRRFHDQDKSGWFVLLNFIPLIGGLIVFVFMLLEGTRGPNQYGPDPKA